MEAFTSLEDQVRECFGRVVYTHKTHEKMADRCGGTLRHLKLAQIILAALTASGATSSIFVDQPALKIATAVVSFCTLWISGYTKGFDPGGTAQKHRDAAASLWPIRESYLSLLTEMRMRRLTDDEAIKRRDDLQAKLAALYKGAPQTTAKAYAEAQKALQRNEDYTFSDAEIDKFVPASLRKGV
ncbi:SLATT domain-containing protein [Methylobacterium sp. Leaf88]|uniref:SLATT domain-containing protein n=1 Tax=Methylobacterium sp. Leaf88 TaxID=1736244 RepID=UPI0006F3E9D1|nr:SLATT domain-containing protein [Methylobacterium sp. Leaf88]KQO76364.1 hypothetical protein ASF20_13505 [Methylobacterium sp. Leaf88]